MERMERKEMETVKLWTEDEEGFIYSIEDGEWIITRENELRPGIVADNIEESDVKARFFLYGVSPTHTTDWLRFFCEERHPEIDFDKEFETDTPGVFARYHDRFGRDYEEWVAEEKYNRLKEELAKLGYRLPWE